MTGVKRFITVPIIACTLLLAGCNSGSTTGRSTNLPTEVEFRGNMATRVLSDVSGNNQVCPPGATLPEPLKVLLTDSENRPLVGAQIFWTVTQGNGAVLGEASPFGHETSVSGVTYTNRQGVSSAQYVTGVIPGRNSVVANAFFTKDRPLFISNTR